jgi:hypothetical protein
VSSVLTLVPTIVAIAAVVCAMVAVGEQTDVSDPHYCRRIDRNRSTGKRELPTAREQYRRAASYVEHAVGRKNEPYFQGKPANHDAG